MAKKRSFDLFKEIEDFFTYKIVYLPDASTAFIARIIPWISLISLLSLPAVLQLTNIAISNYMSEKNIDTAILLGIVILTRGLPLFLELLSIPFLLRYKKIGWNLFFIAFILGYLHNFTPIIKPVGIVTDLVILYLIFQLKREYK